MDTSVGILNSLAKMHEFAALTDAPNRAVMGWGILITQGDIIASPKTTFYQYFDAVEIPQYGPNNPYLQQMRAAVQPSDYLDSQTNPVIFDPNTNAWAIMPSIALANRQSEVMVTRFRELPRGAQAIYFDMMWQEIPNWAWAKIEERNLGIDRAHYNALLRAYQHEIIVRLKRAGVLIGANNGGWAHPMFDEIFIENERPGQGGTQASVALALFQKQQEYVPGSIGTLWYAPIGFSAPRLAQVGIWA